MQSLPRTERWSLRTIFNSPPTYCAGCCTRGKIRRETNSLSWTLSMTAPDDFLRSIFAAIEGRQFSMSKASVEIQGESLPWELSRVWHWPAQSASASAQGTTNLRLTAAVGLAFGRRSEIEGATSTSWLDWQTALATARAQAKTNLQRIPGDCSMARAGSEIEGATSTRARHWPTALASATQARKSHICTGTGPRREGR